MLDRTGHRGRRRLAALGTLFAASGQAGRRDDPVAGVIWITAAMALLAALGVLGRAAAFRGFDPSETVFFRNAFCVIWLLPLLAWRGPSLMATDQPALYALRVMVSFIAMSAMFQALARIPNGEVTAIGFLAPIFGTLIAILLLGERVPARRWLALAAGLAGALVILRPAGADFGPGQVFALISALGIGAIGPLVKQLSARDDADRIVFLTNLAMTPLSLVPALFVWRWPCLSDWPMLAALGLVAVLGHLALVRGYLVMDASLAMTMKFSRLPFAVLLGWLAFGEMVDLRTWVGALVIFVSAAAISRSEARPCAKSTGTDGRPRQDATGPGKGAADGRADETGPCGEKQLPVPQDRQPFPAAE